MPEDITTQEVEQVDNTQQQLPEQPPKKLSVKDFAAKIKEKYPEYNSVADDVLVNKMIEKYPVYQDQVDISQKKNLGQPSKDGGQVGISPTPSPSPSQLPKVKWEENPLNPLAAANKAQAKKEEAQKIMPQPTPTIGKRAAPVKATPQRSSIAETPKEGEGFLSTISQMAFAPLSKDYVKYFYNQILSGIGEISSSASDLVMQGLVNVLPEEALGGTKDKVLSQWRNEAEPIVREGIKQQIGTKLPKEKEAQFDNNLVTSAVGGIGRMIPALTSPYKAGIFLQAYDNGIKSVNESEVGKNLPESVKTIWGTANGVIMKTLMDFQLDKIFGKQAPQVASKITANIFSDLLKNTEGTITKEAFEAAANNAVKGLKNKIVSTGGNLAKTGLESTLLGAGFGAIDIASKEILNKSTGKKVFEGKSFEVPKDLGKVFDANSWGDGWGEILHSGASMGIQGLTMRGAFLPFANTDNYIKSEVAKARTPEDINSLKTEIISQVNEGKISPEDAQRVSDTIDKYVNINSKIPADVPDRERAIDLVEQKDDLKQAATDKLDETKVIDEAFHPQIQQEATALLNRANELNQEITGQPSEPAKHSMYADPLELPELKEQITDIQRRIDLGGADGEKAKQELTDIKTDPIKFYEDRKQNARENLTEETDLNQTLETYDNIINKIKQYDKENEAGLSGGVGVGEEPIEAKPIEGRGTQEVSSSGNIQAQGAEGKGEGVESVGEKVTIPNVKDFTKQIEPTSSTIKTVSGDKAYNYINKDGVEVTLKEDEDGGYVNGNQVQADVHLDFIGNDTKRGEGLASKELDRIIAQADKNDMSISLVVDSDQAIRGTTSEKGLSNKELKKWYESKGFIFDRDSRFGYRPKATEDASIYKKAEYIAKKGEVKIDDIQNHSSPEDLQEAFDQDRLKEGTFHEDGDNYIYKVENGKLKEVKNVKYISEYEKGMYKPRLEYIELPKQEEGVEGVGEKIVPEPIESLKEVDRLNNLKGDEYFENSDKLKEQKRYLTKINIEKHLSERWDNEQFVKSEIDKFNSKFSSQAKKQNPKSKIPKIISVEVNSPKNYKTDSEYAREYHKDKNLEWLIKFNDGSSYSMDADVAMGNPYSAMMQAYLNNYHSINKSAKFAESIFGRIDSFSPSDLYNYNPLKSEKIKGNEFKAELPKQEEGVENVGEKVTELPEQQQPKIQAVEQEQTIKQMMPFTDKMVEIEREFKNNEFEINTDYDNEIQVLDKKGEQVEPDELPNNLRKLAADYEKATSKLGEFDASAREKALAKSREVVETEAEVVEPKKAELPKQIEPSKKEAPKEKSILTLKTDLKGDKKQSWMIEATEKEVEQAKLKDTPRGSQFYPKKISDIERAIKQSKYEAAIKEGRMTAQDAKQIIESAGLEVPKTIKDLIVAEKQIEPPKQTEQPIAEVSKQQLEETNNLLSDGDKIRKEGKYVKDGVEYVRNEKGLGVKSEEGGDVRFTSEPGGGGVSVPFKYKLVEAETLQPSHQDGIRNPNHFIWESQPKNRNDVGSIQAEESFANKPRFEEMGENTNAYSGAPVVNERNEVIQGNNRSAGLRKGYQRGNEVYKKSLAENAEKFGFSKEQVEGMKNPVLVREVAVSDSGAIELGNYDVKDLESGGKRRLDPITITRRMPFDLKGRIADILFKGEETLNQAIRSNTKRVMELIDPYLNQSQRNTILKDGNLTEAGIKDLESVVQHFLFDGGDPALPDLYENLSGTQKEALRKSLPHIFSTGTEKSIVPEVQEAVIALNDFGASGVDNFDNWLSQSDMFNDGMTPRDKYSPTSIKIAEILHNAKTQKEVIAQFGQYAEAVKDKPATMFEEATKGVSKKEGIKQIFKTEYDESKRPQISQGSSEKILGTEEEKPQPIIERGTEPKPTEPIEPAKPAEPKPAKSVEPPIPPTISKQGTLEGGEDALKGITMADNAIRRQEIGMPERMPNPETVEGWRAEAEKKIADGYNINDLIEKMERGEQTDKVENEISRIFAATLDAEVKRNPSNENIDAYQRLIKAREKSSSEIGRALRSLQGVSNPFENISDFYVAKKEANKVDNLTDAQKAEVQKDFENIQKAKDEYEKKWKEAEAKFAEMQAQNELLRQQKGKEGKKYTKEGKRDFTAERKDLKEQLKNEIQKYKNNTQKLGISSNGGASDFAITVEMAKIIGKIAKSHVEEVGAKLSDVTQRTFDDVKDLFDGITTKDIHDVIAGKYSERKETKSELLSNLRQIQAEAKLLNELDRVLAREPKDEKQKIEKNQKLADLRKQINDVKKSGGLEEYSEEARIEKATKAAKENIKELEDKIAKNDLDVQQAQKVNSPELEALRKKQKQLRDELDSKRKEEGLGKYSEEARAKRAIEANKRKEEKIKERLANNDFDPETKRESIYDSKEFKSKNPKLYKELLDSQVKKQEAELEFHKKLVENEMANMGNLDKFKQILRKSRGTIKSVFAGVDLSAMGIQNIKTIATNPVIGAKAIKNSMIDFWSQKRFDRYLEELHNSPDWGMMKESGLQVSEPKSLLESGKEEMFLDRFKAIIKIKDKEYGKIKIGGKEYELFDVLKPFERAFTSLGNNLRVIKFRTDAEQLYKDGVTFENKPGEFKALARRINNNTSAPKIPEAFQSDLVNMAVWSPRLMASHLNMLGISDLLSFTPLVKQGYYRSLGEKGKVLSRQQLYAAADLAKFATSMVAVSYLLASSRGGEVNTSPFDNNFMDIEFPDGKSYNFTGGFSKYIATLFQIAGGGKVNRMTGEFEKYKRYTDRGSEVLHFLRGKMPPISGSIVNLATGRDYTGKETSLATEAERYKMPMAVGQIYDQIQRDGYESLFGQGIPTFIGINVKDKRNYMETGLFTKEDISRPELKTLTDKGLSIPRLSIKETYKVKRDEAHPEGVMTDDEYKDLAVKVHDYMINGWEDEDGNMENGINGILNENYNVQTYTETDEEEPSKEEVVLGKDLPAEQLKNKLSNLKDKAVKKAIEDMGLTKKSKIIVKEEE